MTHKEFSAAVALAQTNMELSHHDIDLFDGYGTPGFCPVCCTLPQVARLIRWQCQYLNGGWDMEELNTLRAFARTRFTIVGFGDTELCDPEVAVEQLLSHMLLNGGIYA